MKLAVAAVTCAAFLVAGAAAHRAPSGDARRGEVAFQKCYACHSVRAGEVGLSGPNLRSIVGGRVAAERGFDYSPALRRLARRQKRWTSALLSRFLADPEAVAPGTSMTFTGMASPAERADLIAFLRSARARR